jgi:flagellar hook-associated protein 3 FlgL
MRISNAALQQRIVSDIQERLVQLARAQQRASTGSKLDRLSDDPVTGALVLRHDRDLRAIAQYRRNAGALRLRLEAEEGVLDQLSALLERAKELGVTGSSSNSSAAARTASAAEVTQLLEQALALGNTRLGNEYIFGGTLVTAVPFQNGSYAGNGQVRFFEIGAGMLLPGVHTGQELLLDSGVVAALAALRDALQANDQSAVAAALSSLDNAHTAIQTLTADVGARMQELDIVLRNHDALEFTLTARRSELADVPLEEALMNVTTSQTALQAALQSVARILSTSLAEFLR